MAVYILLTRVSPEAIRSPLEFEHLNQSVSERIKIECPDVQWRSHYLTLGPFDYLDIFEAPDNESAAKVAVIVRASCHGTTEVWPAVSLEHFREIALRLVS